MICNLPDIIRLLKLRRVRWEDEIAGLGKRTELRLESF